MLSEKDEMEQYVYSEWWYIWASHDSSPQHQEGVYGRESLYHEKIH